MIKGWGLSGGFGLENNLGRVVREGYTAAEEERKPLQAVAVVGSNKERGVTLIRVSLSRVTLCHASLLNFVPVRAATGMT